MNGALGDAANRCLWRWRLEHFYSIHNPEKAASVSAIIDAYEDAKDELMAAFFFLTARSVGLRDGVEKFISFFFLFSPLEVPSDCDICCVCTCLHLSVDTAGGRSAPTWYALLPFLPTVPSFMSLYSCLLRRSVEGKLKNG
ncbi:4-nitrophenylphosphatase [Trypanosoma cruzi]|nr:4-nitrophenylphosphatase [Trypanosoma cruzi]